MSQMLALSFLFFMGSVAGWVIELVFRRFFSSANPERKWINPGFCTGPYVPLYGLGLAALYLIVSLERYSLFESVFWTRAALFVAGAAAMTAIEYAAGALSLKLLHVRLWDYSNQWGNVRGLICPKFSLAWAALVAVYYFAIHPISSILWPGWRRTWPFPSLSASFTAFSCSTWRTPCSSPRGCGASRRRTASSSNTSA